LHVASPISDHRDVDSFVDHPIDHAVRLEKGLPVFLDVGARLKVPSDAR
jgi:hypothetical protein